MCTAEMIKKLKVFLDVDEYAPWLQCRDTLQLALIGRCSPLLPRSLEEIGDLEGYIGRTETVLVFSSKGCERECLFTRGRDLLGTRPTLREHSSAVPRVDRLPIKELHA